MIKFYVAEKFLSVKGKSLEFEIASLAVVLIGREFPSKFAIEGKHFLVSKMSENVKQNSGQKSFFGFQEVCLTDISAV